jgi:hypothetical protein
LENGWWCCNESRAPGGTSASVARHVPDRPAWSPARNETRAWALDRPPQSHRSAGPVRSAIKASDPIYTGSLDRSHLRRPQVKFRFRLTQFPCHLPSKISCNQHRRLRLGDWKPTTSLLELEASRMIAFDHFCLEPGCNRDIV